MDGWMVGWLVGWIWAFGKASIILHSASKFDFLYSLSGVRVVMYVLSCS
jgi:hypothetical protein